MTTPLSRARDQIKVLLLEGIHERAVDAFLASPGLRRGGI